jgi:acyl-homoserine-lactone acylase
MVSSCRLVSLGALLVVCSAGCGHAPSSSPAAATEILWDDWGVPHIFAPDTDSLFYAQGWAHATNHGDLVLRLYGEARGRAAEYWGAEHADRDRFVHTVGIPERATAWYAAQSPRFGSALDAFARGINDYAARYPDRIADEVEVVLPVTATDVVAHLQRIIHFTFVVGPQDVQGTARRWQAGSNAWAVGPARSASGNAILVANPHLPWSGLFTWIETHLVTPEVDVTGASLVGTPFIGIGFNDHLGWTHTVNTHDGADFYELTLRDGGYVFDGETRGFETETVTLCIREGDALRDESLVVRHSIHGPIVHEAEGKALALRTVGLGAAHLFEQYWEMAQARNLEEFETAQRRMQMPMFTTMYADRDGHILHLFGGETPVRPRGDWDFWQGVVPGTASETLWSSVHRYDELPRVVDPASGWLQNANDPPWTTTFPEALDADAYPAYMAPRFMHFRAQRSARMLMEDESLTFDEVVAAKLSTRPELADRLLDDLLAAVETRPDDGVREAAEVLAAWDRMTDAASRGAVLFAYLYRELRPLQREERLFAEPWDAARPLTTPDGLADPDGAVRALSRAAGRLLAEHGALDVAWGDVYRLRRNGRDLPANGGPGGMGIFRVVGYAAGEDGKRVARGGDSYVAVVEFSDPLRARTLLTYGNASQPGSPHNGDQLELFAAKKLRPVWRERAEIEAHLARSEVLDPAGDGP